MNITQQFLVDPSKWKECQIHLSAMQALFGGWRIFVFGDRDAIVQHVSPITREKRYRLKFSETEFISLLEDCIEKDLLTIDPSNRPGHPDETMIQITIFNHLKESRTASKWAGEKQGSFDAISSTLFALTAQTLDMMPYHTGSFDWFTSPIIP